MCIRDRAGFDGDGILGHTLAPREHVGADGVDVDQAISRVSVSYTHLRAHETVLDLVCRLLLDKKKTGSINTLLCCVILP